MIHSTAIISDEATIGTNVSIGPYSIIGNAIIGDDCIIHAHVVIEDGIKLGSGVEVFPGGFLGKEPKGPGVLARKPVFEKTIVIGNGCQIGPHAIIYYDVQIGCESLIGDGASIREKCLIGSRCIVSRYVTVNYNTIIGDGTKIMDNTHITGNSKIGNNVFISTLVGLTNDNVIRAAFADHIVGPIIEDNAIIGVGASVLPAVRIGQGAIVGAGSVVTKNVAARTLVMGVPAKFVRTIQ